MENLNLYNLWQAAEYNDNNLAKSPLSIRLPTHIVARITAISRLFPNKKRTEVIIDILKAGLIAFEKSLPKPDFYEWKDEKEEELFDRGEEPKNYYPPRGVLIDYYNHANNEYVELEKQRGDKDAKPVFKVKW